MADSACLTSLCLTRRRIAIGLFTDMSNALRRLVYSGLILACGVLQASDQPPTLKLPDTVVPTGYQVALKLDPNQTTFSGTIRIQLEVKQASTTIWLNAMQIEISE